MSTLDRALKSLQMIKFAKNTTTNFYWRSYLDPEADAYDAVKQEILNKQEALGNQKYTVDGAVIPATAATAAFDKALNLNEDRAEERRSRVYRSTPHRLGVAAGGLIGGNLGYLGLDALANTFGLTPDKGGWRKWLGRGLRTTGVVGGALTGAALGGNIGANWYANDEGVNRTNPFRNGEDVLRDLNSDLDAAAVWPANTDARDKKPLNFIDISVANKARSEAKKRKEDVMSRRSTKK